MSKRITQGGSITSTGKTIILSKPRIFSLDIGDYIQAVDSALDMDYSRRAKLYDLYTSILNDGHLTAIIGKRKASSLCSRIIFKRNGQEDEAINDMILSPWFDELVSNILDNIYWGFSLIQLYKEKDGWINSELIRHKHVDPQKRLILRRQTDISGASWDEFSDLLFVGSAYDLGLLAKAAPYALYKRNSLADWAQFCEIFGMPLREYTYDANDPEAKDRILSDIYEQGSLAVIVHPEGSEVKMLESPNKTGSVNAYDRLIIRCNNEMSKIILGNTLSTESGTYGTQALAEVQQEGEDYIRKQDRKMLLNILNYDLADYFLKFGINTKGGRFEFDEDLKMSTSEFLDAALKMQKLGVPIDPDEVYERTGFRKPKQDAKSSKEDEGKPEAEHPVQEQKKPQQKPAKKKEEDAEAHALQRFVAHIRDFFV